MNFIKKIIVAVIVLFGVCYQSTFSQQMQELSMTMQALMESVQENNIQLKMANTSVRVADARIGDVKTNRPPNIGFDTKVMYLSDVDLYDKGFDKVMTMDIPNFGHQMSISANQLIFGGGKINKSVELAELSKDLIENQLGDTEQSVKLNATALYLKLYNLHNQKKILEQNRVLAHERSKNARYFFSENMITKNEVLRAEVLEKQLDQSILQVQNAILIINKNLTLFAGLDENVLIVPDLEDLKHQISNEDEVFYRTTAFNKNPQLASSGIRISMAEKNLQLSKSDRLPILAGFAAYGSNRPQVSSSPAMDFYANSYQVGLNLSYNIESLYKSRKKEAIHKILIDQAEQQNEGVRQQIEADVNAAYKGYHQSIKQHEVSEVIKTAADDNYRITELKYKNQLVTYIEIIDAANTKLQAELQTLDDQTNIILNYVKLLRVTGQL